MVPEAQLPRRHAADRGSDFTLSLLNHASILLEHASGVRLLTDPWYSGYCFEQGWGLRFANSAALERAATATHLWISHFHDDHMHVPTLKEICRVNPNITVLANASFNFNIATVARRLGFVNVIELREREPLQIAPQVVVTRYPVTGIDNMLLIDLGGYRVLNYNDCNLSAFAQRRLAKKLGRIDLLLSNFNHAGKLLHSSRLPLERIRTMLVSNFRSNYEHFDPFMVVPFASHHYYRAPESVDQNESMIDSADLVSTDPRIVDLKIGDSLRYESASGSYFITSREPVRNELSVVQRGAGKSLDELLAAGAAYSRKLRSGWGVLARALPSLLVDVVDLGVQIRLRGAHGINVTRTRKTQSHIACHSEALYGWLTRTYGTDGFAVGAHFRMLSQGKGRVVAWIATGLLVENRLDAKCLLRGLFSREGRAFLYNRREEILGILLSGKIFADYHKEEEGAPALAGAAAELKPPR